MELKASSIYDKLETRFTKAGGAVTYLQLVNMISIQFADSSHLLLQIQEFQDNYIQITPNGHSKLSKDLTIFMSCSHLPKSYDTTTW